MVYDIVACVGCYQQVADRICRCWPGHHNTTSTRTLFIQRGLACWLDLYFVYGNFCNLSANEEVERTPRLPALVIYWQHRKRTAAGPQNYTSNKDNNNNKKQQKIIFRVLQITNYFRTFVAAVVVVVVVVAVAVCVLFNDRWAPDCLLTFGQAQLPTAEMQVKRLLTKAKTEQRLNKQQKM